MLALLPAAPALRAVAYPGDDEVAVCECRNGDPARPSRVIGWIDDQASARAMLDRADHADCQADLATWSILPLRYGPYCSTWVLPEHHQAPATPGGDE